MNRIITIAALSFALLVGAGGLASAATPASTLVADEPGEKLTLTRAKEQVSQWLAATGKRDLRPGDAVFDGNGNVNVTLVNFQGLAFGHVLVHAADLTITDSRTGAVLNGRG